MVAAKKLDAPELAEEVAPAHPEHPLGQVKKHLSDSEEHRALKQTKSRKAHGDPKII
jgi:hypothetical protein